MFSFGKKKNTIQVIDVVFMTITSKWLACLNAIGTNKSIIFIAWFEETRQQLQHYLEENHLESASVILYREANAHVVADKQIIFIEHYPLSEKEAILFTSLNLSEVRVFSALEEPFFQYFGGGRIMELMKKMGAEDNEPIEHPMIGMALKNAQEKLSKKVIVATDANSQSGWFSNNLPT